MNTKHVPQFSARKKNKDYMRLLHSIASFQDEVRTLRKQFGIKDGGNIKPREQELWIANLWNNSTKPTAKRDSEGNTVAQLYVAALNHFARSFSVPENFIRYIQRYVEEGIISYPLNNFDVTPSGTQPRLLIQSYAKLSQKEGADLLAEIKRMGKHLPLFGTIKDIETLLESEKLYEERAKYNKSSTREYKLTVKEMSKGTTKQTYENMRMLNDHRKKRFGKK